MNLKNSCSNTSSKHACEHVWAGVWSSCTLVSVLTTAGDCWVGLGFFLFLTCGRRSRKFSLCVWRLGGWLQGQALHLLLWGVRLAEMLRGEGHGFIFNRLWVWPICGMEEVVIGFLVDIQLGDEKDGMLTGMLLLLAGELPLEGALPVELHAPLLLFGQWGSSWSWSGVDQSWQVIREAWAIEGIWVAEDVWFRGHFFFN